jgi:hypothetical protein
VAYNGRDILLAWTEGMGWNKGGKLAWQVDDADHQPITAKATVNSGSVDGVPASSLISAAPVSGDQFVIIY